VASMEILGCSEPWFYGTLGSLDSIGTFGSSDSSDSAGTLGSSENPPPSPPPPPREGVFFPNVCCGSHGSSVISCVAWHIGSCFSDTCDDDDDDVLYLFLQKQNRSRAPPMCDWDIPDGILDI